MLKGMSARQWWLGAILALTLVRLGMWWLILHDVPHVRDHADWYFYQGGDHALFFQMAQSIAASQPLFAVWGAPMQSTVGVGLPLVMALFIRMSRAVEYQDILPMIVIWNGIFLGVTSVPVMAGLALALSGKWAQAFWVAATWTLMPYLLWLGFAIHPEAESLRNAYVPRQLWMTGLSDGPSLFFVALGLLLAVWAWRQEFRTRRQTTLYLCGGISMGLAIVFRIHVLPIAAVVVLALLWTRQWRSVVLIMVGILVGFSPPFWYNAVSNGHPFNTPYLSGWLNFSGNGQFTLNYNGTPFSPAFLIENVILVARRLPVVTLFGLMLTAVAIYAFVRNWRKRGSFYTIIIFGAPLASFALHVTTFVYATDPVRFTLPAVSIGLPALVATASIAIDDLKTILKKRGES